jgi:hypothetical protein
MENSEKNASIASDVLHFENHSTLSAEAVAKAVQRHNREHKGDAQAAQRALKISGKKR